MDPVASSRRTVSFWKFSTASGATDGSGPDWPSFPGRGYTIAIPDSMIATDRHFAELADIVRLEVDRMDAGEVAAAADRFSRLNVKLLADRIDSYDAFEVCRGLNFDYFQGQFFCKPRENAPDLLLNRAATVRLLAKLRDPNLTISTNSRTRFRAT